MKKDRKLLENNKRFILGIPKKFAETLNIEPNEILTVQVIDDKIVITKKEEE